MLSTELSVAAQTAALRLFNVLPSQPSALEMTFVADGFVTNFTPSPTQLALLRETFEPVNLVTLFSLEQATEDLGRLLIKQVLHYVEVYGLEAPGPRQAGD